MRGSYKGFSYTVYYISAAVLITFSMLSGAVRKNTGAMIVFMLLALIGGVTITLLASRIPCRINTDESGFTITEMGEEHRFEYDSVTDISFECVYARYGALIKLTIKDESMGETVFREVCPQETVTSLMNDPEGGKCPQLVRLCRYVKQVKGAAV